MFASASEPRVRPCFLTTVDARRAGTQEITIYYLHYVIIKGGKKGGGTHSGVTFCWHFKNHPTALVAIFAAVFILHW